MTTLQVTMPDEIQRTAAEVARKQHISVDELLVRALMEKLSALVPDRELEKRARRASKHDFDRFLEEVPDIPSEPHDRL